MGQIMNRVRTVVPNEGLAGLPRRVVGRFVRSTVRTGRRITRRPKLLNVLVLQLDYRDMAVILPPSVDLEIEELSEKDDGDVEAVAAFHFYGHSRDDVLQFLRSGEHCYIARSVERIVCCYWRATCQYYDHYLRRRFFLADNEEYLLGWFTLPEFRSAGILRYLICVSACKRLEQCPDLRATTFVRPDNIASLQAAKKLGFSVCGRVGFIEVCGMRFHYLLGRHILPATRRRNYVAV